MTLTQSIKTCLCAYITFSGRASRSEYWWFMLFYAMGIFLTQWINGLQTLFILGLFLPMLTVSVRRLHDIDRSGWWMLLLLIPVIGSLILLFWHIQPSTAGDNRYGKQPI